MEIQKAIEVLEYTKGLDDIRRTASSVAIDIALDALNKQIPKKAKYSEFDDNGDGENIPYKAECPLCGYEFEFGTWNECDSHHCICGQRMEW